MERDCGLVGIQLSLGRNNMRFSDGEFCGVFNGQDAVFVWNGIGENVDEGRFARAGSPRYEDVVPTPNGILKIRGGVGAYEVLYDEVFYFQFPGSKFPNCEQGMGSNHGRNDG